MKLLTIGSLPTGTFHRPHVSKAETHRKLKKAKTPAHGAGAAAKVGNTYLTSFGVAMFVSPLKWVFMLAPLAMEGDGGARLALATTAVVMLVLRKPLPAIAAGIMAAAVFRQLGV